MTDEVTDAPAPDDDVQDSPVETAPTEDSQSDAPQPIIDWQKRAEDNQAWATRTAQELAEEREARLQYEAQLQALREQPDDEDDDFGDDEYIDPVARQHIAQLEAQLAERQQQESLAERQDQEYAHIDAELDAIEEEFKDELSDKESKWIGNYALANRDEHGRPDVRVAYATYNELLDGRKSKWVDKKKSASTPAAGPGAVEVPSFESRSDRIAWINEQVEQRSQ